MYGKPTKQHACIFSCAHIHVESSFPSVWCVLSRHNTRYFFGFVCLWLVVMWWWWCAVCWRHNDMLLFDEGCWAMLGLVLGNAALSLRSRYLQQAHRMLLGCAFRFYSGSGRASFF